MSQKSVTRHIFQKLHLARLYCKIFSRIYKLLARCEIFISCKISCKITVILQDILQEIKYLQVFLQVLHARFSLFSCKICKKTDILRGRLARSARNTEIYVQDYGILLA